MFHFLKKKKSKHWCFREATKLHFTFSQLANDHKCCQLCNGHSGGVYISGVALNPTPGLSETLRYFWVFGGGKTLIISSNISRCWVGKLLLSLEALLFRLCAFSVCCRGCLEFQVKVWKLPHLWQARQASSLDHFGGKFGVAQVPPVKAGLADTFPSGILLPFHNPVQWRDRASESSSVKLWINDPRGSWSNQCKTQ